MVNKCKILYISSSITMSILRNDLFPNEYKYVGGWFSYT